MRLLGVRSVRDKFVNYSKALQDCLDLGVASNFVKTVFRNDLYCVEWDVKLYT